MTILPEKAPATPTEPVSGVAVVAGVLVAYGAFALLISLVAAFANGAHANQVLSAATWKQLKTGGGIMAGLCLLGAWWAGGYIAARLAGRDGARHGVWVFVTGIVLITVVSAAVTWLPDTATILRNLRLLGLPVRRAEWGDIASVAAIASLAGMAVGAVLGGANGGRVLAPAPAQPVPVGAPLDIGGVPAEPGVAAPSEPEPVPAATPSLFEEAPAYAGADVDVDEAPVWAVPGDEAEAVAAQPGGGFFDEAWPMADQEEHAAEAPAPAPAPAPVPGSWWPSSSEPQSDLAEGWALPDDLGSPEGQDDLFAFPPSSDAWSEPVVEPDAAPEPAPLAEHADWAHERGAFQAPPDPGGEDFLQHEPEAMPAADPEEEERRRQRDEAAEAYDQARDEQP